MVQVNRLGFVNVGANRNTLPLINATIPGYGSPVGHVQRAQSLKANQLELDEAPKRFKRRQEQHEWYNENRTISQEVAAIRAASAATDPEEAKAIYERTRPKGARAAGLGKPSPSFKRAGGKITIDGGPGKLKIEGPETSVEMLLEEVEKNPDILKNPEYAGALGKMAAELGVSITQNKQDTWKPQTEGQAKRLRQAGSRVLSSDVERRQKRIDNYHKEVARLPTVRERIRKGDRMDQMIKLLSPEARKEMGIGTDDSKEEALRKIDDYERWLRRQIRGLEGGGSAAGSGKDPLGLLGE